MAAAVDINDNFSRKRSGLEYCNLTRVYTTQKIKLIGWKNVCDKEIKRRHEIKQMSLSSQMMPTAASYMNEVYEVHHDTDQDWHRRFSALIDVFASYIDALVLYRIPPCIIMSGAPCPLFHQNRLKTYWFAQRQTRLFPVCVVSTLTL